MSSSNPPLRRSIRSRKLPEHCMFKTKKGGSVVFELLIVYVLLSVYSCPYLISCVTSYVTFLYMCMRNTVGQLPIDFSRLYGCDWTIASRVQGYHNSHAKLLMDKASKFSPTTFTLLVTQIG